jgi:hypothetical protein
MSLPEIYGLDGLDMLEKIDESYDNFINRGVIRKFSFVIRNTGVSIDIFYYITRGIFINYRRFTTIWYCAIHGLPNWMLNLVLSIILSHLSGDNKIPTFSENWLVYIMPINYFGGELTLTFKPTINPMLLMDRLIYRIRLYNKYIDGISDIISPYIDIIFQISDPKTLKLIEEYAGFLKLAKLALNGYVTELHYINTIKNIRI